jgi:hypothetical protein
MDLATLAESLCLNISGPVIVGSGIRKVELRRDLGLSHLTVCLSFLAPTDRTTVGDLGRLRALRYSWVLLRFPAKLIAPQQATWVVLRATVLLKFPAN